MKVDIPGIIPPHLWPDEETERKKDKKKRRENRQRIICDPECELIKRKPKVKALLYCMFCCPLKVILEARVESRNLPGEHINYGKGGHHV